MRNCFAVEIRGNVGVLSAVGFMMFCAALYACLLAAPPTYAADIAPIVSRACCECHRDGGVAPFALASPQDLIKRARTIARAVRDDSMPPWFAVVAEGSAHRFKNDASLSAADKATLLAWLDSDERALGDLSKAPPPRPVAPAWRISTPDVVFEIPAPVEIKAKGTMNYVNVRVPTNFTEDVWVREWEVVPSAREAVHHVLVFARPPEAKGRGAGEDEGRGFFAAFVPGGGMRSYDSTRAKKLPKGSTLIFQLHYTPNGQATQDRTKIGLVLAKTAPEHEVRTVGIFDSALDIPPHTATHREMSSLTAPADIRILSWMPHMHTRGKSFVAYRKRDGAREVLIDVPRYDFNWQLSYDYATPLEVSKGTLIHIEGVFDNSAENSANPDPSKRVRWGQQTTDEMLIGYIDYELAHEIALEK